MGVLTRCLQLQLFHLDHIDSNSWSKTSCFVPCLIYLHETHLSTFNTVTRVYVMAWILPVRNLEGFLKFSVLLCMHKVVIDLWLQHRFLWKLYSPYWHTFKSLFPRCIFPPLILKPIQCLYNSWLYEVMCLCVKTEKAAIKTSLSEEAFVTKCDE